MFLLRLVAFLLLLWLIFWECRALLVRAGFHERSVAACFAVGLLATVPPLIGRWTGDIGVSVVLLAALLAPALRWRPRQSSSPPVAQNLPRWPYLAIAAVNLVLVAATALRGRYFDEDWCHYQLSSVLVRGVMPLQHPLFPGAPFRYHYGFDALVAEVVSITGLSVEDAVDVVKVPAFLLLQCVAAAVGGHLAGRRGAGLALVLVPLGSSPLSYLLFRGMGQLEVHWPVLPEAWATSQPVPPVIVNFFQHPQGLGMPLSLAALRLLDPPGDRPTLASRLVAGLMLGTVSLVQVVFFTLLLAASTAALVVCALRDRRFRTAALDALVPVTALASAVLFGGFFVAGPGGRNSFQWGHSYFGEPIRVALLHHLVVLGLPLLAFPVALVQAARKDSPRSELSLLLAAGGGLLVPCVTTYARSWDIVKFLTIGAFFLNLVLAAVVARSMKGGLAKACTVLVLVVSSSTSWAWLARTTVLDGRYGIHRWQEAGVLPIAAAVLSQYGPTIPPNDRVFSTNVDLSKVGFLTPGFDWREVGAESYMLDFDAVDSLVPYRNRARMDLGRDDLRALGVRWVALSRGDIASLSPAGRATLEDAPWLRLAGIVTVSGEERLIYRIVE